MPLLFGDLIHAEDKYWHLLLLLLQIVNIVFSPILSDGMTIYLKHLITDHHRLFKQLFPAVNLLPKHDFLIHYPRSIRNIGPVLHMWCMRYEAKHHFFKSQLKNLKNITLTLAKKHQSYMAMCLEVFSKERLTLGPGKMVLISDLIGGPDIAAQLGIVSYSESNSGSDSRSYSQSYSGSDSGSDSESGSDSGCVSGHDTGTDSGSYTESRSWSD